MRFALRGHGLAYEGAPHTVDGERIGWSGVGGVGHAKCSCGAISLSYNSGTERRAWHRRHKDLIREAREAVLYVCPRCCRAAPWTNGLVRASGDIRDEFWCTTCGEETALEDCELLA